MFGVEDVNGAVDDEADECECETENDEGTSSTGEIRGEGENQQHDGSSDVGRDSIQICLDDGVTETLDDLGQEERHRLERNTKTYFDG